MYDITRRNDGQAGCERNHTLGPLAMMLAMAVDGSQEAMAIRAERRPTQRVDRKGYIDDA